MSTASSTRVVMRRAVLRRASGAGLGLVGSILGAFPGLAAPAASDAEERELVRRLTGRDAIDSTRVHLEMPAVFSNGYSVPMTLAVDSPMTEADHVRLVQVVAPRNPIIVIAVFHFTPRSGRAAISTRVRLAEPQNVIALAEMSDGTWLMARTRVKVDTDGCA